MGNRITRTVLFAAFAILSMSAFGAGAARFGTLRNSDWVVTNAWQAVSNKTHDLILEIGHGDSLTGIVDRALSYGTENYWTDSTGIVWVVVGSTTNIVGRVALTNDIPDSVSADLTPATNYTNQVAEEFEEGTRIVREAEIAGNAALATNAESADYAIAADGLIGLEVTYNWSDLFRQSTNAAIAVADAKISTNNPAFVSAVLAAPLVGADPSDLAEIAEYGSYGTVGAAILALIAGLAALKRRIASAEAAIPYAMYTPQMDMYTPWAVEWTPTEENPSTNAIIEWIGNQWQINGSYDGMQIGGNATSVLLEGEAPQIGIATYSATRSLAYGLHDRANNIVDASTGNKVLILPPFNNGRVRDLLVACTIGVDGNSEPWSVIFQGADGEEISFKAEGDDAASATFPVPDAAGDWWYSLTERAPHVFAVSLKQLQSVTQGGS